MKEYDASKIRNIALVGHGSAGKTILAESMLACSGALTRIGSVEQGSTVSDYHEDEQQRQISIHTTSMFAEWNSCKLNILDNPGYADFIGESLSAFSVSDVAILTVHGAHGIELGTEQMWKKIQDLNMPVMVAVNVLDAEYVKFDQILEDLSEQFGKRFFPMTLPVNEGPGLDQIIDVKSRKLFRFYSDSLGNFISEDLPKDW